MKESDTLKLKGDLPLIETERLIILRSNIADKEDLKKLYLDENVWTYLGGLRSDTQADIDIDYRLRATNDYWTVRNKESSEFIGQISIAPHHDSNAPELSYEFLSTYWGNGYAREAIQAFINYMFTKRKLEFLLAETQSANKASRELLKYLNFREYKRLVRFTNQQIIYIKKKN